MHKFILGILLMGLALSASAKQLVIQLETNLGDGADSEAAANAVEQDNGDYVIFGTHTVEGDSNYFLTRTDDTGNTIWSKTYGGIATPEDGKSMALTSDAGYIMVGQRGNGSDDDIYLVKADADGIVQWELTFGGTLSEEAQEVIQTSDGGYALRGLTYSLGEENNDFYVAKISAAGVLEWENNFPIGPSYDGATSIKEIPPNPPL